MKPSIGITLAAVCVSALCGCATPTEKSEIKFTEKDSGRPVEIRLGDSFTVELKSNPSTGYGWKMKDSPTEPRIIEMKAESFTAPQGVSCGAPGKKFYRFSAVSRGKTTLHLLYLRPWEKPPRPAAEFKLPVTVR